LKGRDAVRLQPSGAYAANLIGLSNKCDEIVFSLTDGRTRAVPPGREVIQLRPYHPRNMATAGRVSGLVIQALRSSDARRPRTVTIDALRQRLTDADKNPASAGPALRARVDGICLQAHRPTEPEAVNHLSSCRRTGYKSSTMRPRPNAGLPAPSLEKDFGSAWTLRETLPTPALVGAPYLQGGTSLSKAWKLIERFSEDIDIVIDRELPRLRRRHAEQQAAEENSRRSAVAGSMRK